MKWMNYLYVTLVGGRKERIRHYKDYFLVDNWGQMFRSLATERRGEMIAYVVELWVFIYKKLGTCKGFISKCILLKWIWLVIL
jgi:hypothetical protein